MSADADFSFSVPSPGWERFGNISLNKSIVGPQGAEAIIFWSRFPDGRYADACANLRGPSMIGTSAAELASAVARAPGTELVAEPSHVRVGGRSAEHVVVRVEQELGCEPGFFYSWRDTKQGALWDRTSVGDTIRVWIVEVGDTPFFIEAETSTEANAALEREIEQIIDSIRFGE